MISVNIQILKQCNVEGGKWLKETFFNICKKKFLGDLNVK